MIGHRLRFLLVVSGLAASVTLGQDNEAFRRMNQPMEPFRIAGNLYYVGASDVTAYLVTTGEGHILLDTGFKGTVPIIRANVKKLGFALSDIKVLLNTHAHIDHAGGLAELKELTGAKLMAMDDDVPQLRAGGKGDYAYGDSIPFPVVTLDRILHDGDKVALGDVEMVAHKTPGHTRGCTTWTMKVRDGEKTCDVVFIGSPTLNPNTRLSGNEKYPNVVADYRKGFEVLKALKCDIFLGAHGSYFDMADKIKRREADPTVNPFIDPTGYRKFIEVHEQRFLDQLKSEAAT
ncbi:MAG: hypothetical protein A2Y77_07015 [Planctomycetes bacterium RBG_13_62_9]|nr:MAG: hypothetical protein A2Y77_07015 [Planctomycetes bacterium RBG_13_62_9]